MRRRNFLQLGICGIGAASAMALDEKYFSIAANILTEFHQRGQLAAGILYVEHAGQEHVHYVGACRSKHEMFLIASISKPISAAAMMVLADDGKISLDDKAAKYIPEFSQGARDQITVRQLLTHVSGLPDQLPENAELRKRHAPLSVFVKHAMQTPLLFEPGTRYSYSSMAILLAAEIVARVTSEPFHQFVDKNIFQPLDMRRSALGLGEFSLQHMMRCQVEDAAPESGAGDPNAKSWDWNSRYWRELGAPWGGAHSSAADIATFLREFLQPSKLFKPESARAMIRNHNPEGLRPRGLGFDIGKQATSRHCSETAFGHGGSTGTLCWADPQSDAICVVLTTLPSKAAEPHPRKLASDAVAAQL